jgi:hypothetical protein
LINEGSDDSKTIYDWIQLFVPLLIASGGWGIIKLLLENRKSEKEYKDKLARNIYSPMHHSLYELIEIINQIKGIGVQECKNNRHLFDRVFGNVSKINNLLQENTIYFEDKIISTMIRNITNFQINYSPFLGVDTSVEPSDIVRERHGNNAVIKWHVLLSCVLALQDSSYKLAAWIIKNKNISK